MILIFPHILQQKLPFDKTFVCSYIRIRLVIRSELMKIGIVGLPNVGKSTLFKALTQIQVDINNYPFCTIEPNVGVVEVPDERVDNLAQMSNSEKKIYATIEFVDIAGLVEGAAEGQGLGNKFLHNIREVDAICQVVRLFENGNITHVAGAVDPARDIDTINTELILADLETVQKRLAKVSKEARSGDKTAIRQQEIIEQLKNILDQNDLTKIQEFTRKLDEDFGLIKDLHLLSFKPILYVFNSSDPANDLQKIQNLKPFDPTQSLRQNFVTMDIKIEEEMLELTDEEQKELELKSHLNKLIQESYKLLGLMTYLTTGEKETRAWTVPKDSTAPRAARAIHGDFEEKFICAEVISCDNLINSGSYPQAKEKGLTRTEGKEYIVQDGDVMEFKI